MDYFIYGSGPFEQLVMQWNQMGIFTVLLPFLLVFAVVFAILEKVKLLQNKAVHVIIALAIALFTVANPYTVSLFVPIFSNLGLGIAILVCLVIVLGLAVKPEGSTWNTIFLIAGILIFIMVVAKAGLLTFVFKNVRCGPTCQAMLIFVVVIVLAIVAALAWGNKGGKDPRQAAMDAYASAGGK